ncbi:tetratricopeptide repeat protein [Polyangium spumosum]|uniref:Tetratricopeptide repeat protein n=2 Tax=Polyangium spumosum TaxID=889282 RepID=A0A6N7PMG0_9BACT|nr:tetratricopeptide repeat protein [Polyangium spumosum]
MLFLPSSSRRAMRALLPCITALVLAACGSTPPPKDPDLVADPPLGGTEGMTGGAAQTDFQRAVAFIEKEQYAAGKVHLKRALEASPDNAEAHAYMGLVLEKENDLAGAEKSYLAALERKPGLAAAAQNLAAIYLSTSPPRTDDAIKHLRAALEKTPGDVGMLRNLGYALGLKGDVEGASKAYETAITKGDSVEVRFEYAAMLAEAKQHEKAVPHLKKVLEGTKDDPAMLVTVGRMLGYGKAFGDCVAAFDRALELEAKDPEWFVRRGTCKHELGDEAGALADYQESTKVKPDYAAGYYYMGLAQLALKKPQSAEFSMGKAAEFGKDTPIGKAAKDKLRELKSTNKR